MLVTSAYDVAMPKTARGGARSGFGLKRPDKETPIETTFLVPMSNAQKEKVKELGFAAWVRMQIDAAKVPADGEAKRPDGDGS